MVCEFGLSGKAGPFSCSIPPAGHREALTQLTAALPAQEAITAGEVRALAVAAGRAPPPIALSGGHPMAG